jgi:hypothetical protein
MESALERRFRRSFISRQDFERALEFIAAARRHEVASIEHEALLVSAIIHYARPFSDNEKPRKGGVYESDPRIDPEVGEIDDDSGKLLHERIISARNQAIAHSSFARYPVQICPGSGTGPGFHLSPIALSVGWHVTQEQIDLDAFEQLTRRLRAACQRAVNEDMMRPAAAPPKIEPP